MRPSLGEQNAQWHWQIKRSWRKHTEHEGLNQDRNDFARIYAAGKAFT